MVVITAVTVLDITILSLLEAMLIIMVLYNNNNVYLTLIPLPPFEKEHPQLPVHHWDMPLTIISQ